MKRIALIASMLFMLVGISFAQTTPAKDAKKPKTSTTAKTATKMTPAAGPTKKDGTPDMRYKANKVAAKTPPAHIKKDGTPDMRYKENKQAAGKKVPAATPKKTS